MTDRSSNIDKILDISSFTSSRGFIVSSSDEEDNAKEISKSSTAVGSRLSNLFGTPQPKKATQLQNDKKPLFADSVQLLVANNGKYEPKGQVGVVVLWRHEQWLMIIYNAEKKVIAQYVLIPNGFSLVVQFGSNSYLTIQSSGETVALVFEEARRGQLELLTAILIILGDMNDCEITTGEGQSCSPGCHILIDEKWISIEGEGLEIKEKRNQKYKLTGQSKELCERTLGLGKGGSRVIKHSHGTAVILTVKKMKFPQLESKSEPATSIPETSNQVPVLPDDSNIEEVVASITEKANDVLSRIAKVGQPIIPIMPTIQQETKKEDLTYSSEEILPSPRILEEKPSSSLNAPEPPTPATVAREFSTFHTIVGTEMDRLEIRLEAAIQMMINRTVEPLQKDIKQLLQNQEKILEELQRIQSRS